MALAVNEKLLENSIVSLRLNYLLVTRQFERDVFIYCNAWFRECELAELAINKFYANTNLVKFNI